MFEKYKDGDLITLKLMHGEEVIGTLQSQTETTLEIKKALTLMQGPQGLAFGTFFSTADQLGVLEDCSAQTRYSVFQLSTTRYLQNTRKFLLLWSFLTNQRSSYNVAFWETQPKHRDLDRCH